MKKLLITCAAVMTACVAFAAGSMAATTEVSISSTAQGKVDALAAQQLTVIIVPADTTGDKPCVPGTITDDMILYINQGAKGEISFENMKVIDALADGTYYTLIGGENVTDGELSIIVDEFTVGKTVIWGDVDSNGSVGVGDVGSLERYLLNWGNTIDLTVADVDSSGTIGIGDVGTLERHILIWDGYLTLPVKAN